jgi:hypothetical protein
MFDESSSLHSLDGLSNDELLTNTQRLVGCGNQLLAALLAHLGEVEARGVHRERSCASLYTYCVYVLRMPEDSALRRAKAARIVREYPATLTAIARGELHLTGLLLLGPHLTEANLVEVLALAKHRSKKEIEKLIRRLDPFPDVPPRIEPLGPARVGFVTNFAPTWNAFAAALAGPVRDLSPGERPSDWTVDPNEWVSDPNGGARGTTTSTTSTMDDEAPMPHVAERYKVQFTANQEYVDLLEEARDLLSHASPKAGLDEVHRRALECLVKELRKKKYGETDRPRDARVQETTGEEVPATESSHSSHSNEPERTTRHIPARVRRRVAERDGRRCTYVDACGQRCRETRLLEFHHLDAHANGGLPTEENLTLRCRAHNTLAAEEDFGREPIREKRGVSDPRQRGESDQRAGVWSG